MLTDDDLQYYLQQLACWRQICQDLQGRGALEAPAVDVLESMNEVHLKLEHNLRDGRYNNTEWTLFYEGLQIIMAVCSTAAKVQLGPPATPTYVESVASLSSAPPSPLALQSPLSLASSPSHQPSASIRSLPLLRQPVPNAKNPMPLPRLQQHNLINKAEVLCLVSEALEVQFPPDNRPDADLVYKDVLLNVARHRRLLIATKVMTEYTSPGQLSDEAFNDFIDSVLELLVAQPEGVQLNTPNGRRVISYAIKQVVANRCQHFRRQHSSHSKWTKWD
ncbi:hypothetical protein BC940DRAFT_333744 [Gongronella butleri]|nr:hypothetical protein BC940DRAFT_333744 [Gongronella butleri]